MLLSLYCKKETRGGAQSVHTKTSVENEAMVVARGPPDICGTKQIKGNHSQGNPTLANQTRARRSTTGAPGNRDQEDAGAQRVEAQPGQRTVPEQSRRSRSLERLPPQPQMSNPSPPKSEWWSPPTPMQKTRETTSRSKQLPTHPRETQAESEAGATHPTQECWGSLTSLVNMGQPGSFFFEEAQG